MTSKIGVLLTNIGSPDQPTPAAVRHYLKQFLSDPRVVEIPRIFWWPILHGIILRTRPKKSAELYQKIWTDHGSPLVVLSQHVADRLQTTFNLPVVIGMHYGNPSIQSALEALQKQGVDKIVIMPMYPQYSATTTAASFDQVSAVLKQWRKIPEVRFIHGYADDENYICAVANSIQSYSPDYLLFSFHGIPQSYIRKGDPYLEQCTTTTQLITQKLQLSSQQWSLAFQSRLGRAAWLTPYTEQVLKKLPEQGHQQIHVVCPGFAVDCLETLEEIALRGKEQFMQAGGKSFHYIPALNDSDAHQNVLEKIILKHLERW